jgi:hypothetical protein
MSMEKFSSVLGVGGVGMFLLAGVVEGWLPSAHLARIPVKSIAEVAPEASPQFRQLAEMFPAEFQEAYGQPTGESFRKALVLGKRVYIAEACWHCHSQYIRPVSNEDRRFGLVSTAAEYQNEMFLPHLFGTRRVGPDLIREAPVHSVDWHVAHFYDPMTVVPTSVMPRFPWLYNGEGHPNEKGIALITYVTWLGSWAIEHALPTEEAKAGGTR